MPFDSRSNNLGEMRVEDTVIYYRPMPWRIFHNENSRRRVLGAYPEVGILAHLDPPECTGHPAFRASTLYIESLTSDGKTIILNWSGPIVRGSSSVIHSLKPTFRLRCSSSERSGIFHVYARKSSEPVAK